MHNDFPVMACGVERKYVCADSVFITFWDNQNNILNP